MKTYIRPVAIAAGEGAEGVFAASGYSGSDFNSDGSAVTDDQNTGIDNGGAETPNAGGNPGQYSENEGGSGETEGFTDGDIGVTEDDLGGGTEDFASASYSYEVAGAWDGNINYNFYFTNESNDWVDKLTVRVPFFGNVVSVDGGVVGFVDGSELVMTFNNWGNGLSAGETSGSIYVHVTGIGDFGLQ